MTPKQQQRLSRVVWFEIPVADFDRACGFYENLLKTQLRHGQFGPDRIAVFPYDAPGVSGCIMESQGFEPGNRGSIVCLNADPELDEVLSRVEASGGKVVTPKTDLPPGMGVFARIQDTEGNVIGLHAA